MVFGDDYSMETRFTFQNNDTKRMGNFLMHKYRKKECYFI